MRPQSALAFFLLSAAAVLADVGITFVTPKAGASNPGSSLAVSWKNAGESPGTTEMSGWTLELVFGGNDPTTQAVVGSWAGTYTTKINSATETIDLTKYPAVANAYFLRMTSTVTDGGTVINYSNRFNLPSMAGPPETALSAAVAGLTPKDVPDTVNSAANDAGANAAPAAPGNAAPGSPNIPYSLQTGLTRYAPMQSIPPTKISVKDFTPLYPTSPYVVAKTFLPRASILTTVTAQQTFSVDGMENTAAPQSQPSDDMAKFLARWKD